MCILNWFIVNTNRGNLIRTCHSETRRDYLIVKLVVVYRWYETLPLEWNKIIVLPFFHKLITLFHFSPAGKKRAYLPCMFLRKQGYHVTNFARKTKVSNYKCWRWKYKVIKLATTATLTVWTNSNWKLFLGLELISYIQVADDSNRTISPA